MKNVLFIASEAVPFIKTGGLGRCSWLICQSVLTRRYFDVRVMIPKYLCIPAGMAGQDAVISTISIWTIWDRAVMSVSLQYVL